MAEDEKKIISLEIKANTDDAAKEIKKFRDQLDKALRSPSEQRAQVRQRKDVAKHSEGSVSAAKALTKAQKEAAKSAKEHLKTLKQINQELTKMNRLGGGAAAPRGGGGFFGGGGGGGGGPRLPGRNTGPGGGPGRRKQTFGQRATAAGYKAASMAPGIFGQVGGAAVGGMAFGGGVGKALGALIPIPGASAVLAGLGATAGGVVAGGLELGKAGFGAVNTQARMGYQQRMAYGNAYAGLAGISGYRELRGTAGKGQRLGYDRIATAGQMLAAGRATGSVQDVTSAQAMSRLSSLDVGGAMSLMGTVRKAGAGFGAAGQQKGEKVLKHIMETSIYSGLEKARLPEFAQGVTSMVTQVGGRLSGDVNVASFATLLGQLGASGKSGFQGARGAAVAGQLNAMFSNPGSGEQGKAFMLQSAGFGRPGGGRSLLEAEMQLEKGMSDPENIRNLAQHLKRTGQTGDVGVMSLKELSGLSFTQSKDIMDMLMKGQLTGEGIETVLKDGGLTEEASKQQLLDTVKREAYLRNRLITIGSQLKTSFEKLDNTVNALVTATLPAYVKGMEWFSDQMKDAGDEVVKFINDFVGVGSKTPEGKAYTEMNTAEFSDFRKSLRQGDGVFGTFGAEGLQRVTQLVSQTKGTSGAEEALLLAAERYTNSGGSQEAAEKLALRLQKYQEYARTAERSTPEEWRSEYRERVDQVFPYSPFSTTELKYDSPVDLRGRPVRVEVVNPPRPGGNANAEPPVSQGTQ